MKVIIVGGVAGGASCAARLRRLDEKAEIVLVERGPYVSYANCGLPYHVGGVIEEESSLLVATEQMFRAVFAVDCRTNCEAVAISAGREDGGTEEPRDRRGDDRAYDKLVLSPGAAPIRPPLPGIDLPGIFSVRTVPDARRSGSGSSGDHDLPGSTRSRASQTSTKPKRAVVVGGGFIGLEMAENLVHRGLEVTLVEMLDQVMPPLDPEMARLVERHLEKHGVKLALSDGVAGFTQDRGRLARGPDEVRQGAPGGHRDPRHRRAAGNRARQDGRPRDRRSAAGSASTSTCARATPTSSPSATRSRSRTSSPGSGR